MVPIVRGTINQQRALAAEFRCIEPIQTARLQECCRRPDRREARAELE
jgi:hypothetical protein